MERPVPPEFLYHGTATRFLDDILKDGLKPMSRQWVHISPDIETAVGVGKRHGTPVVLVIRAKEFVEDGYELLCSANGVWQAKAVPPKYFDVCYIQAKEGVNMSENVKYPIIKRDGHGREVYREEMNGHWEKREYDEKGRQIYWEINNGAWARHKYDENGYEVYYENSSGYWYKREYTAAGFMTYYEDSCGNVRGTKRVDDLLADATAKASQVENNKADKEQGIDI